MKQTYFLLVLIITTGVYSCSKDEKPIQPVQEEIVKTPTLTTQISNLSIFSVDFYGKILNQGGSEIIEAGIVFGIESEPTINSNLYKFPMEFNENNDFSGVFPFLGIPGDVDLYIRSYGINSDGIGYGNEIKFTTPSNKAFDGDVVLSTQEEVIEFGASNYNSIKGTLEITGNVTDLAPLNSLGLVKVKLDISNTTLLSDLNGLENIIAVGFDDILIGGQGMEIVNNASLSSLNGINGLEAINGGFRITDNDMLENLNGLGDLWVVQNGVLSIADNDNLTSLSGLNNLQYGGWSVFIDGNSILSDITALSKLEFVSERIGIRGNSSLARIDGLEGVKGLNYLDIEFNESLTNLDAIKDIDSINVFTIRGNNNLTQLPAFNSSTILREVNISNDALLNLSGFINLRTIGTLNLNNSNIPSLIGLDNLEVIENTFNISNCSNLNNLEGLSSLYSVGEFIIQDNVYLSSIEGLQSLNNVGHIGIYNQSLITNIDPLNSLREAGGISFGWNHLLNNIDGIQNINELGNLHIDDNERLVQFPNFGNLASLINLSIENNSTIVNLEGLHNLITIKKIIIKNSTLNSLEGLTNLETIGDYLSIERCFNLEDLSGLDSVMIIGPDGGDSNYGIFLHLNTLKNLEGLNSLTQLNGDLDITSHSELTSLNGLEGLTNIGNDIKIQGNSSLDNFCSLTNLFLNYSFTGNYQVLGNSYNPSIQDIVDGNCN